MSEKHFPSLGDFENRCIIGPAEMHVEQMMPDFTYYGLSMVMVWPYGTFVDKEGNLYIIVRDISPRQTGGLMVFSNRNGADNMMAQLAEIATCHRGLLLEEVKDGKKIWESPRPNFRIDHDGKNMFWFEKNILEIQGESRGPCLQWYDPTGKQAYISTFHRSSGKILGQEVEGWHGLDFMMLPPGGHYIFSPMVKGRLLILWAAIANEYEDGSWEVGQIGFGDRKWGFAYIYTSEGKEIIGTKVEADFIEKQPSGWPARAQFRFINENTGKEEVWKWNVRPRANLIDLNRLHPLFKAYRGAEAVLSRADESRKVTCNFGWPDFYGDDRVERWKERQER